MPTQVESLELRVLSEGIVKAEKRLESLKKEAGATEKATVSMSGAFAKAGTVVNTALGVMGIGALGLTSAIAGATQEWLSYDKAMKEVKSITASTKAEFKAMRSDVLKLSAALGVDATVAAKGLYQAMSAGIPKENALSFLTVASKAAIAGVTTVDVAVDGLTNTINAFKIPLSETEVIADKLFATVVYGKTTFEELSARMSTASVPAAALGVKLDELLAAVVGVTSQGTPTSEAFTQIRATISALLDPSDELLAVYKSLGVESGRAAVAQFGFAGILQKVRDAYASNDAALIKALRSTEAFNGVLSITGENLGKMKQATDDVANSSGAMGKAFSENANTLENALNALKSSAISLVETIEGSFGALEKFSSLLRSVALGINTLAGGVSPGTASAMGFGSSVAGASAITMRTEELKALRAELEKLKASGQDKVDTGDPVANALDKRLDAAGFKNISARPFFLRETTKEIEKINGELAKLEEAYNQIDDTSKSHAATMLQIQKIQESDQYTEQQKADLTKLVQEDLEKELALKENIAAWGQKDLEQEKYHKKLREDRAASAIAQVKKEEDALKKRNEYLADAAKTAKELATTDEDRLNLQMALVDEALANKQIDQETADKAKANLEEQIKLLHERGAAAAGKGGGGGGGTGSSPAAGALGLSDFMSSLPDLDNPFKKDDYGFEQLKKEEEKLQESYDRRRKMILESTAITEEQRAALMNDATSKYLAIQADAEHKRMELMVKGAEDLFGNLATIANAFGKKGAKVAKALAIVQATVKMYESATSAYASAAAIPYYGYIAAPIAAGAALAAGAANIAAIKQQDESVPTYEHGGMIPAGARGIAGEAGPELITGPAVVTSARTTADRTAGSRKDKEIQVIINAPPGSGVERTQRSLSDKEILEITITEASKKIAGDIRKGGTPVARAIEEVYPVGRGTKNRH